MIPALEPGAKRLPPLADLAAGDVDHAFAALGSDRSGLSASEVAARAGVFGPNAVRTHRVRPLAILGR